MVAHPTSLKRCILSIVSKYQQPLALRMMNHVLSQNMNVFDVGRTDRLDRLTKSPRQASAVRAAAHAGTNEAFVFFLLLNDLQLHGSGLLTAVQTARHGSVVGGAATQTELQGRKSRMILIDVVVFR